MSKKDEHDSVANEVDLALCPLERSDREHWKSDGTCHCQPAFDSIPPASPLKKREGRKIEQSIKEGTGGVDDQGSAVQQMKIYD